MPRPAEFEREQALRDAMTLFWRQGYTRTSMRDLTEATQLQPGSLYGAFSNKRGLFLESLDYYAHNLRASADGILRSDAPPKDRIRRFFDYLLNESARDRERKGCLLVKTLLEVPADEADITQRAAAGLQYVETAFAEVIEEARQAGELAPDIDPKAHARLLMTAIFGLRVYAKYQAKPKTLKQIVDDLLMHLGI